MRARSISKETCYLRCVDPAFIWGDILDLLDRLRTRQLEMDSSHLLKYLCFSYPATFVRNIVLTTHKVANKAIEAQLVVLSFTRVRRVHVPRSWLALAVHRLGKTWGKWITSTPHCRDIDAGYIIRISPSILGSNNII